MRSKISKKISYAQKNKIKNAIFYAFSIFSPFLSTLQWGYYVVFTYSLRGLNRVSFTLDFCFAQRVNGSISSQYRTNLEPFTRDNRFCRILICFDALNTNNNDFHSLNAKNHPPSRIIHLVFALAIIVICRTRILS